MSALTKRQAIAEVRALANEVIEQQARFARGWDKGLYRDDEMNTSTIHNTTRARINRAVRDAMYLASQYIEVQA